MHKPMFSEKDLSRIREKGISLKEIESQLNLFRNGIDFVNLKAPATPGNGIAVPTRDEQTELEKYFEKNISRYPVSKFVPASGAASRMFKALFAAMKELKEKPLMQIQDADQIVSFFKQIKEYPFFEDLKAATEAGGENIYELLESENYALVLEFLLTARGLNYGSLPKGLLKFHSYPEGNRTPLEEHFEEASELLKGPENVINLHLTVSGEHLGWFRELSLKLNEKYKKEKNIVFNARFSLQHSSTDTIAVTPDNTPFVTEDGNLLFRPGGHGALLENLNELDEAMIFIGNIDNVSPDNNKVLRLKYKKMLGGFLLKKVIEVHSLLNRIEKGEDSEELKESILQMLKDVAPEFVQNNSRADKRFLPQAYDALNRPIRVCGMVKNVGEPGGGPFWIQNKKGEVSKQIIESSQIDLTNKEQKEIFMQSTHFNPVDLVCFIKDHKAEKFDLIKYRDSDMAFISSKSQDGRELKALELPGLWNGAMAGWLTWFVDVPLETFTPVKTVFDLMRPQHK